MNVAENNAVIDIGTNSARLLIYQKIDNKINRIYKTVRYTRMGQDVDRTGVLHPDAMKRNLDTLAEYKTIMVEYGITDPNNIYIFGTSAMRDAGNTQDFILKAKNTLGLTVEVISGECEARYGFMGASMSYDSPILIFDIGGGSTELILGKADHIEQMVSLNMGCVRGTEAYLKHDVPEACELAALALDFDMRLKTVLKDFGDCYGRKLIGIGGTATTIAAIEQVMTEYDSNRVHNHIISKKSLDEILTRLASLSLSERKQVIGLDAKRADVIVAGCVILDRILTALGVDAFTVCDYDNLEGAAISR